MKFVLVLLAIIACVAAADEWRPNTPDEIKTIKSTCMEEVPLTEEQKVHVKNVDYPNEEAVRKYLLCTMVKMGLFSPNTGYHPDRIAKQFNMGTPEAGVRQVAMDCFANNPKGDKANDVHVYEMRQCFMDSEVGQKIKAHIKKNQQQMSH